MSDRDYALCEITEEPLLIAYELERALLAENCTLEFRRDVAVSFIEKILLERKELTIEARCILHKIRHILEEP